MINKAMLAVQQMLSQGRVGIEEADLLVRCLRYLRGHYGQLGSHAVREYLVALLG